MPIRAGPLLRDLLGDGQWGQSLPAPPDGLVLVVLLAGLLVALLLDRLRR